VKVLDSLHEGGRLSPRALLLVEEAKAAVFAGPQGEERERRAYDDTALVFLRGRIREKGA
jgi:16S rRNA (guanine966-N2)-methyltransferase